jgi:hypothetical protein
VRGLTWPLPGTLSPMEINWGDVATWVTGSITAGSLWLGFSILRSDHKKEERAQAQRVLAWSDDRIHIPEEWKALPPGLLQPHQATINVTNSSEHPVVHYFVYAEPLTERQLRTRAGKTVARSLMASTRFSNAPSADLKVVSTQALPAGQSITVRINMPVIPIAYDLFLRFSDINGRDWTRSVKTSKLWRTDNVRWRSLQDAGSPADLYPNPVIFYFRQWRLRRQSWKLQ